jgi:hypothetical protein
MLSLSTTTHSALAPHQNQRGTCCMSSLAPLSPPPLLKCCHKFALKIHTVSPLSAVPVLRGPDFFPSIYTALPAFILPVHIVLNWDADDSLCGTAICREWIWESAPIWSLPVCFNLAQKLNWGSHVLPLIE